MMSFWILQAPRLRRSCGGCTGCRGCGGAFRWRVNGWFRRLRLHHGHWRSLIQWCAQNESQNQLTGAWWMGEWSTKSIINYSTNNYKLLTINYHLSNPHSRCFATLKCNHTTVASISAKNSYAWPENNMNNQPLTDSTCVVERVSSNVSHRQTCTYSELG